MKTDIINMERDYPTVDQAKARILSAVPAARRRGVKCIKIIHGYGSSGVGGAIGQALPGFLAARQSQGFIKDYAVGADFSAHRDPGVRLTRLYPELKQDSDYKSGNPGITMIML